MTFEEREKLFWLIDSIWWILAHYIILMIVFLFLSKRDVGWITQTWLPRPFDKKFFENDTISDSNTETDKI